MVDHRQVDRLAELACHALEVGPGPGAELASGELAEPDEVGTEGVAPGGGLTGVAARDEGAHEPVDGRHGQSRRRTLAEGGVAALVGHRLEEVGRPIHGLHALVARHLPLLPPLAGTGSTRVCHRETYENSRSKNRLSNNETCGGGDGRTVPERARHGRAQPERRGHPGSWRSHWAGRRSRSCVSISRTASAMTAMPRGWCTSPRARVDHIERLALTFHT